MNRVMPAIAAALGLALAGCASPAPRPHVDVHGAWAPVSTPGAQVGVLYARLTSEHDDSLVSVRVSASVADHAELHETFTEPSGRMGMRRVASVALPARQSVAFRPGGLHIMLIGLAKPLAAGDTIAASFGFLRASPVVVRVSVRSR